MKKELKNKLAAEIEIYKELKAQVKIEEGKVFWRSYKGKKKTHDEAGDVNNNGYKRIGFKGNRYLTHRFLYFCYNKKLPEFVDHADRDRLNNSKENLREATHQENMRNRSVHSNNKSKVAGVCWNKRREKWQVEISIDGTNKFLGYFEGKADAIKARKDAKIKYFGDFAAK